MLAHPTHERLIALGLAGMAKAFEEQRRSPDIAALSFEERVGIMADREAAERDTKRIATASSSPPCARTPWSRTSICAPRAASTALCSLGSSPATGSTPPKGLITGPTGVGKSWIACALGHKACRDGRGVLYQRVPRLFEALALARGDGRYARLLKTLGRVQLLILDDWGLSILTPSRTTRSARNPRRPPRTRFDNRHKPGSRRAMVRRHRQTQLSPTPSWIVSFTTPIDSHDRRKHAQNLGTKSTC